MAEIETPCTLICSIDQKSGYCFGCGRTREEIATWRCFTSKERREVMATLPARLATIERKTRRETRRTILARKKNEER